MQGEEIAIEPKHFELANLIVECSCGKKEVLTKALKDGIQIVLQTTDQDIFVLACTCGNKLSVYFEECLVTEENEPENIQ